MTWVNPRRLIVDGLTIHEIVSEMKRAAFYVRVSQDSQTVENQLLVLNEVAQRSGWEIVQTFADEGISGAKGRDKRPGYDALLKAVARREVQIVAAWSVDRLGRSLPDLVAFLNDIQAQGCDLYLHQQAIDTSTPSGRMLFQMLGVFAEFERAILKSRIAAGLQRARANNVRIGRPPTPPIRLEKVKRALGDGQSIRAVAAATGVSTATVQRVKRSMNTVPEDRQETVSA
jgi:DNA invertase Pin-like site-specific DNA recombinase